MADNQARVFYCKPPAAITLVKDSEAENTKKWTLWKQMWDSFAIITKLSEQDDATQRQVFVCHCGVDILDIYNNVEYEEDEDKTLENALKKIDLRFKGEINETYERYVFNQRIQKSDESFDEFYKDIKHLSGTCNFGNLKDSLIRDRIVCGVNDKTTRKRLLQERQLTLKGSCDICRSAEATSIQLGAIGGEAKPEADSVNKVKSKSTRKTEKFVKFEKSAKKKVKSAECKFCGKKHEFKRGVCPAWGKTCAKCQGRNHFANKCPGKNVNLLDETDDSDVESLNCVENVNNVSTDSVYAMMQIVGKSAKKVKFQLDSGSSINVLPKKYIGRMPIEPTTKKLKMWNNSLYTPEGTTRLILRNPRNDEQYSMKFVISNSDFQPLLGKKACEAMKLINVKYNNFVVAAVKSEKHEVFNDQLGNLPGKVELRIDEDASPVALPAHRVPVHLKNKVKEKLDDMCRQKIIEPVDKPTSWVSQMVVTTKKSGDLRICLNPKELNNVLKREHYMLPTLDDILPNLSKARLFSKLDLKNGYWHLTMDDKSSDLLCFATPFGRYKWLRLPFGLSTSGEIFQKRLHQALDGLENVICVADDILVYGVGENDDKALKNHDLCLEKLIKRCETHGVRLNKEKCQFRAKSLNFLGHVVTNDGLKPDPEKVRAITEMPKPEDVAGIHRLSGTVNYLARFMPKLSEIMAPIRQLTHKDSEFIWSDECDRAFAEIKRIASKAPVLAYYDHSKPLDIQCDASNKAVGSVLLQEDHPIAYMSRAFSDTETRYAPIEKEMLAVVLSLEHFHQYTFGRPVTVYSDHKPLESILKKSLSAAPRRLQNMILRCQAYDCKVIYNPGKDQLLADMLSRAYLDEPRNDTEYLSVNMASFLSISDRRIEVIRQETASDEILVKLRETILQGWPSKEETPQSLTPYYSFRDELTVQDGLIFRGERLVIPSSLRSEMKKSVHNNSHLGENGCLQRARECMYWPGMSAEIKHFVSTCEACRTYEKSPAKEPLMSHEPVSRPWEKVGVDLFFFDGKDYLVTVDYFSNFSEIDYLQSTDSKAVIKKLKMQFARHGIPCQVISDNGSQFTSRKFKQFMREWDFEHYTSSPHYPKSNGMAESAVKVMKSLLKKSKAAKQDPYLALLNHRNTPSASNGRSPAQRLLSRRTRTLLPCNDFLLQPKIADPKTEVLKQKVKKGQEAKYYNKTAQKLKPLKEGDVVRLKPYQGAEWQKGVVTQRLDQRSYLIESNHRTLRRNRAQLRQSKEPGSGPQEVSTPIRSPNRSMTGTRDREVTKDINGEMNREVNRTPQSEKTVTVEEQNESPPNAQETPKKSRYGRVIMKPKKLMDCVQNVYID